MPTLLEARVLRPSGWSTCTARDGVAAGGKVGAEGGPLRTGHVELVPAGTVLDADVVSAAIRTWFDEDTGSWASRTGIICVRKSLANWWENNIIINYVVFRPSGRSFSAYNGLARSINDIDTKMWVAGLLTILLKSIADTDTDIRQKRYRRYRYWYWNWKVSPIPIPIFDELILLGRRQFYRWHSSSYWWLSRPQWSQFKVHADEWTRIFSAQPSLEVYPFKY